MKTFDRLLERYLTPPASVEEGNYIARNTLVILLTLLIGSVVIVLVTWLLGHFAAFRLMSLEIGVILVAIWLVRRGYFTQASSLVLLTFWGLLTYLAHRGDGIHDAVLVAYPAFVVAASLILNRRLLALFVLLLIFSVGLIAYNEVNDFIVTGYNKSFVLRDALIIVIIIAFTAIAMSLLMNNLINSLATAHQNERALTQEVTERKQIEAALRENETLLRAIINHIPFDLWVCDTEGHYIMQNDISFNLAGNLIGKSVDDLNIPPEIYAIYKEKHLRALRGETIHEEIEEMIQGEKRSFDSIQAPIRDGERILGFIGMNIDITERKQAELALQAYSERLEEMVEERTKALQEAQEKLIRQEKLAVLGQLAGSVGHELRNPLGVISNAVYFLQMVLPEADEMVKEYLELISGRVHEVEKIVADLLNLSRTRPAVKEPVAVTTLLEEALRRSPPPEGVIVTTTIPAGLPPVLVDPQQIGSVLVNLMTNAYQAMANGGELTLSAQAKEKWLKLSIADTGIGMSPETTAKIFEPLFTTKAKGIGLGLAVSKSLVEINDGSIEVETIEGKGTMFTLSLPAYQGERPAGS